MTHGTVTAAFGDGTYTFRLAIAQWFELQDKANAGPLQLYDRLIGHNWRVSDLREIIRLGLIGGGTSPADALKLVGRYVDERPLIESVPVAIKILAASLFPPPGAKAKSAGEPEAAKSASTSPPSTATVQ